jgi:EpsD family peptidyl-prolyl cis-trans isomerase
MDLQALSRAVWHESFSFVPALSTVKRASTVARPRTQTFTRIFLKMPSFFRFTSCRVSAVRVTAAAATVVMMISIAGCGGKAPSGPTQVVATVSGEEITELQVNQALERQQGLKPDQVESVSRKLVTGLVDQEVILQKARDLKMDRDQRVVQNVEASKREIIVRAYLERIAEGTAKPTPKEIQAYFEENPALFKERRVYTFQEVSVQTTDAQRAGIEKQLTTLKSPAELEAYFKEQKIPARSERSTTAAENIPLPLLQRISSLKNGQGLILPANGGLRIILLLASQDAPVTEDKAGPAISAFLLSQRKRQNVEKEVVSLRSGAKVEYFGKYADLSASGAASAPALSGKGAPALSGVSAVAAEAAATATAAGTTGSSAAIAPTSPPLLSSK